MHIRCSKLARPMICAGYVFLKLHESPTNEAAEQGTAAGEYLERMLLDKPIGTNASNGYYFDDDMKFNLTPIFDDIRSRIDYDKGGDVLCEQRIDWSTRSGINIKGQYDIAFVDHDDRLCIEDLKYGWGLVEVEENWQLLAYAIGEVIRRGRAFKEICLTIHQPRPHHEDGSSRTWTLSYSKLIEYKDTIEKRMQELVNGEKSFQTSKQCKYCLGTGEACPAFNRLFYRSLEISTESSQFIQDSIDNDELAMQIDQIKRAEEVLKIKKDSVMQLGILRIAKGDVIPGYIQEKKYSNRKWKKGISPEAIGMMTNKNLIKKTMISPADAEKLGITKDLVNQLTERVFTGNKLIKKNATEIGNKIFGNNNPNGGK